MRHSAHEPAIPNRWYGVFRSSALGPRLTAIKRLGLPLVLYRREDGAPAALLDRCPHRGAALSRGRVVGDELECPYHAFRFDAGGQCRCSFSAKSTRPESRSRRRAAVYGAEGWNWLVGDAATGALLRERIKQLGQPAAPAPAPTPTQ